MRAVERAGAEVTLTGDFDTALNADGLLVPGVGAYAACMAGLRAIKGERIIGRRLAGGRPVLGICVGMQILFERGVEHGVETEGCDEWPGVVERIQAPVVPHMGWNTVDVPDGTALFAGIEDERFYFVHSYGVRDWTLVTNDRTRAPLVTWAEHGGDRFVAAVENGPLTATQFHPEKSGDAGAALLRNWVGSLSDEQGARPAPRRARARGRRRRRGPGGRGRAQGAPRGAAARAHVPAAEAAHAVRPASSPSGADARPARRSRCVLAAQHAGLARLRRLGASGSAPLVAEPARSPLVLHTMLFRRS